jgi:hypothetical protein
MKTGERAVIGRAAMGGLAAGLLKVVALKASSLRPEDRRGGSLGRAGEVRGRDYLRSSQGIRPALKTKKGGALTGRATRCLAQNYKGCPKGFRPAD